MATLQQIKVTLSRDKKSLVLSRVPKQFFDLIKEWGGTIVNESAGYASMPRFKCYGRVLQRNGIEVDMSMFDHKPVDLIPTENVTTHLKPYQVESVRFLVSREHRGTLLALRQGLGKTLVSIEAANQMGFKRILVIAPLTLLTNWQREITLWSPEDSDNIHIFRGGTDVKPGEKRWTITNYEMAQRRPQAFALTQWDLIIYDESIRLKTRGTMTWNRCKRFTAQKVWLLSGSPISKDMTDLWAQFALMNPQSFKSYWRFAREYMYIDESAYGRTMIGSKNIDFRDEFSDMMYVVARDEADLNLPPMIFDTVYVQLANSQKRMYEQALTDFMLDLRNGSKMPIASQIAQITRLLQIASSTHNIDPWSDESSKRDVLLDLLDSGEIVLPAIIWVHWIPSSLKLVEELKLRLGDKVSVVTGSSDNRDENLQNFIQGRSQILVISAGTGKYGLTLTMAKTMVYLEKSYNFDSYIQSLDRVQRLGLQHSVTVLSLVAENTIDELVHDNLAAKATDLSKVTSANLDELLGALDRQVSR